MEINFKLQKMFSFDTVPNDSSNTAAIAVGYQRLDKVQLCHFTIFLWKYQFYHSCCLLNESHIITEVIKEFINVVYIPKPKEDTLPIILDFPIYLDILYIVT